MPQIACDIFGVQIITSRDAFPARLNRKWQTDIAKPDSSNDAHAFPPNATMMSERATVPNSGPRLVTLSYSYALLSRERTLPHANYVPEYRLELNIQGSILIRAFLRFRAPVQLDSLFLRLTCSLSSFR